jgi:penicillin-binding protein-related factor A (putative recombinase)
MGTFDPRKGIYRRVAGQFNEKGTSDILGIWKGKMLCIEVKSATGKLRPEQREFLRAMHELGAICMVARSLQDVISALGASPYISNTCQ